MRRPMVAIAVLLGACISARAAETFIYPELPPKCAAVIDQDDKNVVVLIRCKGQIDWVVYMGPGNAAPGAVMTP